MSSENTGLVGTSTSYGTIEGHTRQDENNGEVEDQHLLSIMGGSSSKKRSWMRNLLKFIGPGFMIGVGYLDPGNWATDLAAGSQFGYSLLFIIFIANAMAILLQYLCIKLGVITGNDLAMSCRRHLPWSVNVAFYLLCEVAIIATDLAEVVGTAIALELLFGLPLPWGVALTSLDVLVILAVWGAKNLKLFEFAIMGLVGSVAVCFAYLVFVSNPDWEGVFEGFIPTPRLFTENGMLYLAMGIIGATIMPHNLYVHSSIVRYRSSKDAETLGEIRELSSDESTATATATTNAADESVGPDVQPARRKTFIPQILMFTNIDSVLALTCALLINSAILIVAAASFFGDNEEVGELKDAYLLLSRHLGPAAGVAFAAALLFAGQSSTITGTIAGQIVMEGFLGHRFKISPWLRRLSTRSLAIIPAMTVAILSGEQGMNQLLVASQVVLSVQLPFAVWPLVWFTGSRAVMTVHFKEGVEEEKRSYANGRILHAIAIGVAVVITAFNVVLILQILGIV
ncbi:hypothetical protein HK101_009365 [Irineochytrium annulatum]|nr:hypothetical protein HK101_009365 [Irineochytrium annulatum]